MFSSHSLIPNALVNNDDPLVNIIKQSLNLEFAKIKKVNHDYLLKFGRRKKTSQDLNAENLCHSVAVGNFRLFGCFSFR